MDPQVFVDAGVSLFMKSSLGSFSRDETSRAKPSISQQLVVFD